MSRFLLPLLLIACVPVEEEEGPSDVDDGLAARGGTEIRVDPRTHRLTVRSGERVLAEATAAVWLDGYGDLDGMLDLSLLEATTVEADTTTALGPARELILSGRDEATGARLTWSIRVHDTGAVALRVAVDNDGDDDLAVHKLSPLLTRAEDGGGLYLSDAADTLRILDNGSYQVLDFTAQVHPADTPGYDWGVLIPGAFGGTTGSNWNHAIQDVAGDGAWVAGALTFDVSTTVLATAFAPYQTVPRDGREGLTLYHVQNAYLPHPKTLAPGATLASEWVYVHPGEPDGAVGIERWAEAVAAWNDIVPWHRRDPDHWVPNGWNSWSTSGSTGGYGTDIDEDVILDNLAVFDEAFGDWGMEWFQVDDGYQPTYGDWTWREDRFPHGARWLSDRIRDRGLRPGLWQATLTAHDDAQLLEDHPEWFATYGELGTILGDSYEILDLTHPDVLAWLEERGRVLRDDWGFDWLKLDFGYYAMAGEDRYDPTQTREEMWRTAMRAIRRGLGDDAFFLTVGAMGVNFGIADGNRLTLDLMPAWEKQPGDTIGGALNLAQGIKPTVRSAGRRWYLHDRLWVNHPDLITFRSNTRDLTWDRIAFEETRAFAAFVGLSGGIVKLGDRLVDLTPPQIDVIRQLLPTYGSAATPLDVFTRFTPERWRLHVQPRDGHPVDYDLIGLFHWGENTDTSTTPYTPIPDTDADRRHVLDLDALGIEGPRDAYEFWTGTWLGEVEGSLTVDVPSHDSRVVALRPVADVPHFFGWNRQITMGGTLLEDEVWDADAGTLALTFQAAASGDGPPFAWEIALRVPGGETVTAVDGPVSDTAIEHEDGVARVRFSPEATGTMTLTLTLE